MAIWIEKVQNEVATDPYLQAKMKELKAGVLDSPKYSLHDGLLRRKWQVMLGPASPTQLVILSELHEAPSSGHSWFH